MSTIGAGAGGAARGGGAGAGAGDGDGIDGLLMVPPERSQILGKPVWKTRYVTVARRENRPPAGKDKSSSKSVKISPIGDEYFLSIYKAKPPQDDLDALHQYPIRMVTDAKVDMVPHRKQGTAFPTLIVTITDNGRKRRSSRATGFMGSRESTSVALLFRTHAQSPYPTLHEWARAILSKRPAPGLESPISTSFVNPFSTRSDSFSTRPPSGNTGATTTTAAAAAAGTTPATTTAAATVAANFRAGFGALQHKTSNYTHSSREPPPGFGSDSPSLRSRKSDISSPSTSNCPAYIATAYQLPPPSYGSVLPCEIATSPDGSMTEYPGDFIEGWTAAQGRSSRLTREPGRGSVGSQGGQAQKHPHQHQQHPPMPGEPGSPPGHRETILDRAFHLRYVPGSENTIPGEEKLTSLARFDALMRDADQRRREREATAREAAIGQEDGRGQSRRRAEAKLRESDDVGENSHDDHDGDEDEDDDADDDDDNDGDDDDDQGLRIEAHGPFIPPTTQRALDFISSRRDTAPGTSAGRTRTPVSFYHVSNLARPHTLSAPLRPHTSHTRSRPSLSNTIRTHSHMSASASSSHAAGAAGSTPQTPLEPPPPPPLPLRLDEVASVRAESVSIGNSSGNETEKRASAESTQRLGFGAEFADRLSSTSSLLLMQTNVGNSSGNSSDVDTPQPGPSPDGRWGILPPPARRREKTERYSGWRSSVIGATADGGLV